MEFYSWLTIFPPPAGMEPGLEVIKNFMLNSTEHEILNAHKYKNIKKLSIFQVQISLEWHHCWHFNIYQQENFHAQLS